MRQEAEASAARAAEDASWQDSASDSKGNKKAAAEEKRAEELRRKAERDALEEAESASLAPVPKKPQKKTQFELQNAFFVPPKKKDSKKKVKEPELEPNINHIIRDAEIEAAEKGVDASTATGVDAATDLLKNLRTGEEPKVDAHPERRRKMAFKAYEEREIPRIREENPGLKLSQIKEIIFKNWQKSPENPMNEAEAAGP
mmetsp:Transcript_1077/g.1801  ORF Transcript_1077/g.1801 Transcript_1077/m.1801 type:complete len:201 (+) Transcript_1077:182-784(+)|eukprot:CAMPEP_0184307310 /NCGR_PEP_ID=MMETSP1049-20130417/16092_1 /TAXON_ID=77928 /ORGANISM="Proteomonas sulcata, Strain CCMP704" /LENGTH=200 /DNA_ID=CAMNT_0026619777 /DNA_START=108 /DNA_END=710 /DNA_ORIENTATION=+